MCRTKDEDPKLYSSLVDLIEDDVREPRMTGNGAARFEGLLWLIDIDFARAEPMLESVMDGSKKQGDFEQR